MKLNKHFELIFWVGALVALALSTPSSHHFTLCPIAGFGFSWCPGCGFGRSIASIFHGDISGSVQYHWFGIPGLAILMHRIFTLSKKSLYIS